ncbi:MAG: SdpI family protein [Clostridia bacterium]|nr:SdpI family protein [Clostridia bacterium]
MIKKNLSKLIITSLVILIPILIGIVLWDKLPDQVPVHWNINGDVDGFATKAQAVFLMPLVLVAFQWICVLGTSLDPKKQNINDKMVTLVLWIIPIISLLCNSMVYATALGHKVSVEIIMPLFMGALFVVIGNYMPKCKQSYTMGIKLPWTLNDEENWNKTHRMAGFLWVIGGIVIMATAFLGAFWLFFVVLIPMVIVPFVYSYLLYKKNKTE